MSGTPRTTPAGPLVSVVLPTYNGARYLDAAIASVVGQTLTDWELILVDDCSTDDTPRIVERWAAADARVRSIRHATNQRLPGGLNTGHAAARGRLLTWTSDDNLLRPTCLATLAAFLQDHPDVGLVYSSMAHIDDEARVVAHLPAHPPEELPFYNVVQASFMYRREVWERVGPYDPAMVMAEDYDYWLRVAREFPLAPLAEELYDYRVHAGALSVKQRDRMLAAMAAVLSKNLPHLGRRMPRWSMARGWLAVASIAARRKDAAHAVSSAARAVAAHPGAVAGHLFRGVARRLRPAGSATGS